MCHLTSVWNEALREESVLPNNTKRSPLPGFQPRSLRPESMVNQKGIGSPWAQETRISSNSPRSLGETEASRKARCTPERELRVGMGTSKVSGKINGQPRDNLISYPLLLFTFRYWIHEHRQQQGSIKHFELYLCHRSNNTKWRKTFWKSRQQGNKA